MRWLRRHKGHSKQSAIGETETSKAPSQYHWDKWADGERVQTTALNSTLRKSNRRETELWAERIYTEGKHTRVFECGMAVTIKSSPIQCVWESQDVSSLRFYIGGICLKCLINHKINLNLVETGQHQSTFQGYNSSDKLNMSPSSQKETHQLGFRFL